MTTKYPQQQTLDTRLSRITWFTVSLVVAVFLVAFSFVLYDEQKKGVAAEEAFLAQIIRIQEKAIEQDMFLNLEDAVKLRLDGLVANDRLKAARMRACVRVRPVQNPEAATIVSCSDASDAARFDSALKPYTELPLSIGVVPMAKLQYVLVKDRNWQDFVPPKLLVSILFAIVTAFFLHRHAVRKLQENVVTPLLRQIAEDERHSAIEQTIQMVAHDVRKPFIAVKAAVDSLRHVKDPFAFDALRAKYLADIDRSVVSVDALLADILDLGAKRAGESAEASLVEATEAAFHTLIPVGSSRHAGISVSFQHRHKVRAEVRQVSRVLANLIENALQAVNDGGDIWLQSRESEVAGKSFIEFTVGNTGSCIEPENLVRIFEPFVTTKKSGYGLGLAIASKIVRENGGQLWASSHREIGTHFYFTLPVGAGLDPLTEGTESEPNAPTGTVAEGGGTSNILLFDDEESVRQAWSLLAVRNGLRDLKPFSSWEDFAAKNAFDLAKGSTAFVDIHFRGSKYSGIEIARHLRKLGVRYLYAVTADPKAAVASGLFDDVLGKEFPAILTRVS